MASEGLELPDDIKIEPWEPLPNTALMTIQGVTVAGPARLELLRSFAHELSTNPEKAQELTAIRWEVNRCINKEVR